MAIDIYWRNNGTKSDGVAAHFGLVTQISPSLLVAHVGDSDFRVEPWNLPRKHKIVLLGRLFDRPDEAEILAKQLLNKIEEIRNLIDRGEGEVSWVAAEQGFTLTRSPLRLSTTCVGFVHFILDEVGFRLIDRSTIPLSTMHLAKCKTTHTHESDWHSISNPVRRYFPAFGIRAIESGKESLKIPQPGRASAESPWFTYRGKNLDHLIRVISCVENHV